MKTKFFLSRLTFSRLCFYCMCNGFILSDEKAVTIYSLYTFYIVITQCPGGHKGLFVEYQWNNWYIIADVSDYQHVPAFFKAVFAESTGQGGPILP